MCVCLYFYIVDSNNTCVHSINRITITMPRNQALTNYTVVKDWLTKTNALVKRKLYTLNEIYDFFKTEVDYYNSLSMRSFTIAIGKCCKSMDHFSKVEIGNRMFCYGITTNNDSKYFHNHIRRSQQNRQGKISPHPLGKIIHSDKPSDKPTHVPSEKPTDYSRNKSIDEQLYKPSIEEPSRTTITPTNSPTKETKETSNKPMSELEQYIPKKSDTIAKMMKLDLPMALPLFFGREQKK